MIPKRSFFNLVVLVTMITTLLLGGGLASAQSPTPPGPSAKMDQLAAMQAAMGKQPPPNMGNGQMRSMTNAARQAARLGLPAQKTGVAATYAGLNPATAKYSPLASTSVLGAGATVAAMAAPNSKPDYFGVANWAISPLPQLDASGNVLAGTGMRKFQDTLPLLNTPNNLGQFLPIAVADSKTFANSDYYEVALVEYTEQLHTDLPATKLRGYVQIVPCGTANSVPLTTANGLTTNLSLRGQPACGATKPQYLGPVIVASRNKPSRVLFDNLLPTGPAGNLFIPTDTTYMGAGMGPMGAITEIKVNAIGGGYATPPAVTIAKPGTGGIQATAEAHINGAGQVTEIHITNGGSGYAAGSTPAVTLAAPPLGGTQATAVATVPMMSDVYSQNRATLHLHGGNTPWISDGTPHQWTVPGAEVTPYDKGVSASNVPDMWFDQAGNPIPSCATQLTCAVSGATTNPGPGALTFYWTNQQSGRLMFFHDHAYGVTRLNVYAGEAAGYLVADTAQENALAAAKVPGTLGTTPDLNHVIPLVIQDKTFVPDTTQLAAQDPTWDIANYGGKGALWFPHVYTPNQNPADITGANAYGRWDYGPWFWPAQNASTFVPQGQPYQCTSAAYSAANPPAFPPLMCPGFPNPSGTPEGFMDTPLINGTAYPSLTVDPTAYRFQMLMAGNDRTWNLGLYKALPLSIGVTAGGSGYTAAPAVTITRAAGDTTGGGASATAVMSSGGVTSVVLTGVGAGYTAAPAVTITGDGTGAAANAVVGINNQVTAINVTAIGSGYSYANVAIAPPAGCTTGCVTATAQAFVTPAGSVMAVNVTNPGAGWTKAPVVAFSGGGGTGAAAVAAINSEVKMVDAVPHTATSALPLCSQTNPQGGAMLVTALTDAGGNPLNGTGLQANCWPSTWPTDGRDGGVPDPTTAGPPIIQIGTEGGVLPNPVVIPSTPVGYEYNRRSITVLNVFNHGLMLGPAERADVMVDFSQYAGQTLLLYNDGPAPIPAFDSRNDYYTGDPDQTSSGGAPTTLPGYGPNTRTIMQIHVKAAAGGATTGAALGGVSLTSGGGGYTTPVVSISGGGGTGAAATATGSVDKITLTAAGTGYSNPVVSITGGGGTGATATMGSGVVSGLTLTNGGAGYSSMPAVTFTPTSGGGSLAAASATGAVNAVAVTNGGGGYATMPGVSFTPVAVFGAAASATGAVDAVAITNNGAGYATMPGVTFSAPPIGGTTATGAATGAVDALIPGLAGSGYASAPSVNIADTAPSTGTGALGYSTVSVTGVTLGAGGTGYSAAPTVTIGDAIGGKGTGATAKATVSVTGLTLGAGGSGYSAAPAVGIADTATGTGAGATGKATISVTGLVLGAGGSGYSAAPAVTIADTLPGTGAGATGKATVSVTGFTIANGGTGFTTAPTITISDVTGGAGTGATATATVSGGAITAVTIGLNGAHYTAPVVTITGGGGSGASVTTLGSVDGLTLSTNGAGYTTPGVTFAGGGGTGASASTTGAVDSLTLSTPGAKYTTPVVSFTGGGGSLAAATTTGSVDSLTLLTPGAKYTSPTVTFSGSGTGASATTTGSVDSLTVSAGGAGYTTPVVTFSSTSGSGATASATLKVTAVTVTNGGSGYVSAPTATFSAGAAAGTPTLKVNAVSVSFGGSGYTTAPTVVFSSGAAAATATLKVNLLSLTSGGTGYATAPTVGFSGGGGAGAAATAQIAATGIVLTNGGQGYTSAPTVTVTDTPPGTGGGATATATLKITGISLTNPGAGYTAAPAVAINDTTPGTGTGAGAVATLATGAPFALAGLNTALPNIFATTQDQMIVPQPGFPAANGGTANPTYVRIQDTSISAWLTGVAVGGLILTNGGAGYTTPPAVAFTGGGGTGAAATANLTPTSLASIALVAPGLGGAGYSTPPAVTITGGGGTGAVAAAVLATQGSVNSVTVTSRGRGYTIAPTVTFGPAPVGGVTATGVAVLLGGRVNAINITNPGSGYVNAPSVTLSGGGGGIGATASATLGFAIASIGLTNPGSGFTSVPAVTIPAPTGCTTGGVCNQATAAANLTPTSVGSLTLTSGGTGYTSAPTVTITGGGGNGATALAFAKTPLQPKAIQELFTLDYGRMNATLGVELPFTNFMTQTTIPYGYVDPPTEIVKDGETQFWKITHNGVDTHFIHFHLFTVQVINRVGWDGMIKPPDPNEVAWKDTVRMNPLEDVIVALRPMKQTLPWDLPNSVRPLDVTEAVGTSLPNQFTNVDPTNEPATVVNDLTNFGWEYVWHCHILGHEENDMMRAISFAVPPVVPANVTTPVGGGSVTWTDASLNETGFTIQVAPAAAGPWNVLGTVPAAQGSGSVLSFKSGQIKTGMYVQVIANNQVGYTRAYTAPAVGYPNVAADSASAAALVN